MKFEGTEVFGIKNAFIGMRLPMTKSYDEAYEKASGEIDSCDKTKELGIKLVQADSRSEGSFGQPNSKFLRMIHVQVAITAPLYWWKEFDTYKVGTTANSTSTMHKLASFPITTDCFEMDDFENFMAEQTLMGNKIDNDGMWFILINYLEYLRQKYNETKDKRYWKELIRLLPESWLQTRMIDMDYQTVRNMYFWRKNHKLTEWHSFCRWVERLPYAEAFITSTKESK